MPAPDSQTFLRELDKKLWTAADKLRSNLDAAVYKHAVLSLIFLKYVSDSFSQGQAEIREQITDPDSDYFIDPKGYGNAFSPEYKEATHHELEEGDYYIEKNVFRGPALALWQTLQDSTKLPSGTEITVKNRKTTKCKITSLSKFIDDALEAVEKENEKLKNVLNKNYTQLQIDPMNLAGLIELIELWVQKMLHHLAPNGSMAVLLANGSMSSNSSGDGDIRRALIEADLVECMVALPG